MLVTQYGIFNLCEYLQDFIMYRVLYMYVYLFVVVFSGKTVLDHEWICDTKANGMATMVCIDRKKKMNFAISSCNLVRTLVALQDDARPWLCFHDHNGGC